MFSAAGSLGTDLVFKSILAWQRIPLQRRSGIELELPLLPPVFEVLSNAPGLCRTFSLRDRLMDSPSAKALHGLQ